MVSGLHFIESLIVAFGGTVLLAGVLLACLETGHGPALERGRQWLGERWSTVAVIGFGAVPVVALRWMRDVFDHVHIAAMAEFDRSPVFSPAAMAVAGILLPAAAFANWLLGGSAFLLSAYLCIIAGIVVLAVMETFTPRFVAPGLLAMPMAVCGLIILPLYAGWSLTSHLITGPFAHGVLVSVIVTAVVYTGVAGLWTMLRSGRRFREMNAGERFLVRFLFALPAYYLLYWFALLAGHFAVFDPSPARGMGSLIATMLIGGLAHAGIVSTLDVGVSGKDKGHALAVLAGAFIVACAASLAIAGVSDMAHPTWLLLGRDAAGGIELGPTFWVTHLPFVPWLLMLGAVAVFIVARIAALFLATGGWSRKRPYLASALLCTVVGALVIIGGTAIN